MNDSKTPEGFNQHAYLAAVLEGITDIVTILDAAGIIRYESPAIMTLLGYTPQELIGKNAFTLVHPEDYLQVTELFLRGVTHKDRVEKAELRFRHKNGSWRYLECSAKNLLFDPQIRGIVVSSRDISPRRESEATIRLQASALQAAANGIVITDIQGKIVWVNEAFTQMTGYSFEEAIGQNPRILKSGEQDVKVYETLWKTILSGSTWTGELINRRKDGTLYFERQIIVPMRNGEGDIIHFIAVKEDVSADKKMEAQFRQAQKMEAVGRLAGGVAHDFNNLLTIILGQCYLLTSELPTSGPAVSRVKEISEAGRRASELTRQLLAFSRKQIFQTKVTDLNEIVRNADKMVRRLLGEDIEFVTLLGDNLKSVNVDVAQIDQVIMNLAVNARDAMPSGGKLVLETSEMEVDKKMAARYLGLPTGKYVMLKVQDSGTGMTPEVKAHLFEPFFTTKEKGKGTGLGLATIYGVIKQSLGYIYADSEIGKGTSFMVLFLPAEERALLANNQTAPKAPEGTETILIAEDEELVRRLMVQVLTRQGFQVLEARNGLEALSLAENYQAPSPIRMLLTDLVMPYMGGSELAEKFSKKFPQVKIVFSSGYSDRTAIEKWLEKGHLFIQKPFTPMELLLGVREELDK